MSNKIITSGLFTGQPRPIDLSNEDFLKAVFRDDLWRAHVTGFREDPSALDTSGLRHYWAGTIWSNPHIQNWVGTGRNGFFTISVFKEDPVLGQYRRRKANFDRCYCIVFDDVNVRGVPKDQTSAKVSLDKVKLDPSWVLETSPDNYQLGFILVDGDDRGGKVTALLNGLVATGLTEDGTDPGQKGLTRYVRLPDGSNTKAKYLEKHPGGFKHALRDWKPERKYTLEEIAEAHGLLAELDDAPDHVGGTNAGTSVVTPDGDWQLDALNRAGLVHGERTGAGGQTLWDVTCPFVETHTDRADSGTVYMGGGRWDCRHKCSEWCDPADPEYWRFDEKLEADFPDECRAAKMGPFDDGVDYGDAGTAPSNLEADDLETGNDLFDGFDFEEVHVAEKEKRELGPFQKKMSEDGFTLSEAVLEGVTRNAAWLLKDICPPVGMGVLYGDPGAGKSFVILDMLARSACGMDWHGHVWKRDSLSLYVASEGGKVGLKHRMLAWSQEHNGAVSDDLLAYPGAFGFGVGDEAAKEVDTLIKWLRHWSKETGKPVGMVVLDTLNRNMLGDENSTADMTALVQMCDRVARAVGCFVWLVHHTGKDAGKGARGSSALRGATDVEMYLTRDDGTNAGTIFLNKNRHGEDGLAWGYELDEVVLGVDDDGDNIRSLVVKELASPPAAASTSKAQKLGDMAVAVVRTFNDLVGGDLTISVPLDRLSREACNRAKQGDFPDLDFNKDSQPSQYKAKVKREMTKKGFVIVDADTDEVTWNSTDFSPVEVDEEHEGEVDIGGE